MARGPHPTAQRLRSQPGEVHIILLTAPASVIARRLAHQDQQSVRETSQRGGSDTHLRQTVEPLLRHAAGLEVNTSAPLDQVVATVIRHCHRLVPDSLSMSDDALLSDDAPMSDDVRLRDDVPLSDDVRLRDVEEADLELFFEGEHDPETVRRSRFPPRDRERFMTHWATKVLGDSTVFVQTVTVNGEPAGSVVSWWDEGRRFIGYGFDRRYWGRGIGTKALTLFLRREKTRPLYADPFTGNTGSVRLLEKCGFRRAGTVWYGENEHILFMLSED